MRFGMFFNQINPTKKNSLSIYVIVYLKLFFLFTVILMQIIHIEIDLKKHFFNDFRKWLEKIRFCSKKFGWSSQMLGSKNEEKTTVV